MAPSTLLRAAWLVLGSLIACAGLGWALWGFHQGAEAVLSVPALLRYAGVVVVLAAASYAVERGVARRRPLPARRRAVLDAAIVGFLGGPVLFAVLTFAALLGDCADGAGC